MTISYCNSAHTWTDPSAHSKLYTDFLAYLENSQTDRVAPSENELLLMRMVLNLAAHVQSRLNIKLVGNDSVSKFGILTSYAKSIWPHYEDTAENFDIILDCTGTFTDFQILKDGGWLIQPKEGLIPSSFTCLEEFEFLDWRLKRRDIDAQKFDGTLYIIVPVHNRRAITLDFLSTVQKQTLPDILKIIVVDDGSSDGLQGELRIQFPNTKVLEGDGSLWWGGAINKGLAYIRERANENDFVAFMNNDILLEPGTVEHLLKIALRDRSVCLAPMTVANGDATAPGEKGYTLYRFEQAEQHFSQHNRWTQVDHLFGRCSLFSVRLLEKVPAIDDDLFPQYWGDSDFFLRAKTVGYPSFVSGKVYIRIHHDEQTTGSHHNFFARKRGLDETWRYLTETKSLGAVKYGWRFFKRHNKRRQWPFLGKTIFRALKNLKLLP